MKFMTGSINTMNGILMLGFPHAMMDELSNLIEYVKSGKNITVEIKREKRSNDANAYCWVLCQMIAQKLTDDACGKVVYTKNDIYREAIKKCMHFTPLPIKNEAVENFKRIWQGHGIGWVVEELHESKLKGYTTIAAYHGSSTYDSKEMSRLIDCLIDDCKNLGIQVRPPEEIEKLVSDWEERSKKNG